MQVSSNTHLIYSWVVPSHCCSANCWLWNFSMGITHKIGLIVFSLCYISWYVEIPIPARQQAWKARFQEILDSARVTRLLDLDGPLGHWVILQSPSEWLNPHRCWCGVRPQVLCWLPWHQNQKCTEYPEAEPSTMGSLHDHWSSVCFLIMIYRFWIELLLRQNQNMMTMTVSSIQIYLRLDWIWIIIFTMLYSRISCSWSWYDRPW